MIRMEKGWLLREEWEGRIKTHENMHGSLPAAFEICVLEIAYGRYEKHWKIMIDRRTEIGL